jgi:hypothetical protein
MPASLPFHLALSYDVARVCGWLLLRVEPARRRSFSQLRRTMRATRGAAAWLQLILGCIALLTGCPTDIPCPPGWTPNEMECTCTHGTRSDGGTCVAESTPHDPTKGQTEPDGGDRDGQPEPPPHTSAPHSSAPHSSAPHSSATDAGIAARAPEPPVRLAIDAGGSPFPPAEPTTTIDLTPILPELPPDTPTMATMQVEPLANACGSRCTSGECDDQGRCHECTNDAHCRTPGLTRCLENRCAECRVSADCAPGGTCENGGCRTPSRATCPDGSAASNGSCPVMPKPTASTGPVCNDGVFDPREECELGFGGVPPNVYDDSNCDRRTCKRLYWQPCDPRDGNAACPLNSTCSFGGNKAFCVPRACPRSEQDCTGALASVPEQCPRMPLYPVQNFSTLCFMVCDSAAPRCPRGLECKAGVCLFPFSGIVSVTRDIVR